MINLVKIGKIVSTHGLEGNVVLHHNIQSKRPFDKVDFIFVEIAPSHKIPFFIEKKKVLNDTELLLHLEDIDSVEKAKPFSNKTAFIETKQLKEVAPNNVSDMLIGYLVKDQTLGALGKITDLFETPGQVLAAIDFNGNEALIPLVDATLKQIDHQKKMLIVQLPEGLLDIYS